MRHAGRKMAGKKHSPAQIVALLRQIDLAITSARLTQRATPPLCYTASP